MIKVEYRLTDVPFEADWQLFMIVESVEAAQQAVINLRKVSPAHEYRITQ